MSGLLQSSYINITRVVFPSFVLTFAVAIAISILNSTCVALVRTPTVITVVMVTVSCSGTAAERHGCGQ